MAKKIKEIKNVRMPKELKKKRKKLEPEKLEETTRERILDKIGRWFTGVKAEKKKEPKVCVDEEVRKKYLMKRMFKWEKQKKRK